MNTFTSSWSSSRTLAATLAIALALVGLYGLTPASGSRPTAGTPEPTVAAPLAQVGPSGEIYRDGYVFVANGFGGSPATFKFNPNGVMYVLEKDTNVNPRVYRWFKV